MEWRLDEGRTEFLNSVKRGRILVEVVVLLLSFFIGIAAVKMCRYSPRRAPLTCSRAAKSSEQRADLGEALFSFSLLSLSVSRRAQVDSNAPGITTQSEPSEQLARENTGRRGREGEGDKGQRRESINQARTMPSNSSPMAARRFLRSEARVEVGAAGLSKGR